MAKKESDKTDSSKKSTREAEEILERYADLKDEEGNAVYGTKSKVIESALKELDKHFHPFKQDRRNIWCRARNELNMLLVGKTTFLAYITGKAEDAFSQNIALEAIEWYLGKRVEEMKLKEFLEGLRGMWLAANYFYKIEMQQNEKGSFQLKFNHDLNKDYSKFWASYFEVLLVDHWECSVEKFLRNESFYLIIKAKDG